MNDNAGLVILITSLFLIGAFPLLGCAQDSGTEEFRCRHAKQSMMASTIKAGVPISTAVVTRSDTIDILKFTVNMDITDFTGQIIKGNTKLDIVALIDGVSQIQLDLLAMNIDSVTSGSNVLGYSYNDTLLSIQLSTTLNTGDSSDVTVYYNGSPVKDGGGIGWGGWYWSGNYSYNLGVGFLAIPHNYGRVWHPCFDNFVERATYEFNITTADGRNAVCNGARISETPLSGDTIITKWVLDKSIPTYLACIAVGSYEKVSMVHNGIAGPVEIALYAEAADTANARASFLNLNQNIAAYEQAFGAYSWNKVGYTLVPFNAGAMEHATNIAYPRYAANGSLSYEDLMAHELAHMWWGDLATCETAGDMWLNEGMASFSEFLFNEYVYGWDAYRQLVIDNHESVIHLAHITEDEYRPLYDIPLDLTYGTHVYDKGADIAHTLRGYLGDSLFFGGLTSFLAANKFSHMNSYMLRDHLTKYSGIDMSDFFDKWVFKGGFPHFSIDSVVVVPNGSNFDANVYVKQKLVGTEFYCQDAPLEITFFDANWAENSQIITVSGTTASQTFTIPFNPAYTAINYYNKISDAVSSDVKTISSPGLYNFVNTQGAHMSFTVSSITDSALIRVEHNWTYPDPMTGVNKYKLCPNRYWKIDGILPANYSMTAKVFYDGRTSGSSYYDHGLFTGPSDHEDSLVVMYRTNAGANWGEWPYVTQTVIAANDKWGQVVLDSVALGEYVFALKGTNFSGSTIISNVVHVSCNGACDGSATVTADGGVGPYTYLWNDPGVQQTGTVIGLCPGDYSVIITDAGGDTVIRSVTIAELDSLGGYSSVTFESCGGCNDGSISFTAIGGATPYTYQWNDGNSQTTFIATGLSDNGVYNLLLSDANGCSYNTANLSIGAEETLEENLAIRISPNPSSGNFAVNFVKKSVPANSTLLISDINGRVVLQQRISEGVSELLVNTKHWNSGVYIVTIQDDAGQLFSEKLIYTKD
jgi:aminopeptidase N